MPNPQQNGGPEVYDDHGVTLEEVVRIPRLNFGYLYDFGDSWQHIVTVEQIAFAEGGKVPACVDGKRNRVPEDCGGAPGYQNLVSVLKKPKHPEHDELRAWVGKAYDPLLFDIDAINRKLGKLRM